MSNYSSQCQDLFILSVLDRKTYGTYVEIGGGVGIDDNNTYLLESGFGWRGISLEFTPWKVQTFSSRKNPCLCVDATTANYDDLFQQYNLGPHIDYLQLDIDPPSNTLLALKQIDFAKYSFSVITYEHDAYCGGENERTESRRILESHGYTRVISNILHTGWEFEDWYINEKHMPNSNWKEFIGENVELRDHNEKYFNLFTKFLS